MIKYIICITLNNSIELGKKFTCMSKSFRTSLCNLSTSKKENVN